MDVSQRQNTDFFSDSFSFLFIADIKNRCSPSDSVVIGFTGDHRQNSVSDIDFQLWSPLLPNFLVDHPSDFG